VLSGPVAGDFPARVARSCWLACWLASETATDFPGCVAEVFSRIGLKPVSAPLRFIVSGEAQPVDLPASFRAGGALHLLHCIEMLS